MMESEEVFVYEVAFDDPYSQTEKLKIQDTPFDVILHVGNQSFQSHRIILSATVPYFRAMFGSNMVETRAKEITMENVDPIAMGDIISFVRTNKVKITNTNVVSLLEASIYLQLDLLIDACFEFMGKRIDSNNVLTICACASVANRDDVMEKVDRYVRENFDDISTFEGFEDLPLFKLKELICRDDLNVLSEEIVFETVMKWVKVSETDRVAYLPELLRHVRWPLLRPEYIRTSVSSESLIQSSAPCSDMMKEAEIYHAQSKENSSCSLKVQERYSKRTHHLKCAKLMGCGMYAFSVSRDRMRICGSSINYYDPINMKWPVLCDEGESICGKYLICLDDTIDILGPTKVHSLNLKTLQYSSVEYDGDYIREGGIVLHQYKVYLFGGFSFLNEVHTLDLQNGTYSKAGEMVQKRVNPGVVSLGEHIYVIGGYYNYAVLRSAERYDPATGHCTEISPMLTNRSAHGCAALNGKIYVYGGSSSNATSFYPTCSGEVYDPKTDQWNFVKNMNSVKPRVILAPYANKLYSFDSFAYENSDFSVESYDPEENQWKHEQFISHYSKTARITAVVVTNSASNVRKCLQRFSNTLLEQPPRKRRRS